MDDSAGRSAWRRAFDSYLGRFQNPDIRLGQLTLLWATAMIAVFAVCGAFFAILFWLFS